MAYIDENEWERRANLARQRGASEQYIAQMRQKYAGSIRPNKPKENILVGIGKAVVDPAVKAGRDLVGGGITALGATGELASRIWDKQNKNKFHDKIVQAGMNIMTPQGREAVLDPTGKKAFTTGVQRGAGVASYLVPGGKTLKSAIGLGATSGALYGTSQGNKINPQNIIGGAAGGAIGGGAVYGLTKVPGAIKSIGQKPKKWVADKATQGYNKATPSTYQKAVEEHGIDINELTRRHVPAGADYDAMLGSVKDRGRGGILGEKMNMAEDVIDRTTTEAGGNIRISIDDFVDDLKQEARILKRVPGNESNVTALESLIKETQRVYKNGLSAKRLLEIKRAADSKFGKAVVDETTGSVTAQYQKMLANSSRAKLKALFPDIADALDLETEIFTLRPVLEKARGVANTQGSQIRQGSFSNITDLINPISYVNSALNNPKTASHLMQGGSQPIVNTSSRSLTNTPVGYVPSYIGSGVGARVGAGSDKPQVNNYGNASYNTSYNENGNYPRGQVNHDANIPQNLQNTTPQQTGPVSPSQAILYKQQGYSLKNMWVIHPDGSKIWNPNTQKWMAYDSKVWGGGTKKLTDKQRSYRGAGMLGQEMLTLLESSDDLVTGPIAGRLSKIGELLGTEVPEQTQLKSKIATARTAARNALLGSAMSEQELESYLDAMFDINLPKNVLEERLRTFVRDMETLAQTDTEGVATFEGGLQ